MELNLQNAIINIPNATTDPHNHNQDEPKPIHSRKRKHGPMHAIRVALFMMRGRNQKSKVLPVYDESNSVFRKLLGSMRPLHLQSNQSPRHPQSNDQSFKITLSSPSSSHEEDEGDLAVTPESNFLVEEPYSPSPPSSRYASAVGLNELVPSDDDNEKRSRYASAIGLNEFVQSDEDNENQEEIVEEECEENGYGDHDGDGDDMIDAKADEFIAQFYMQMRLQCFDIDDPHYKERSQRSLGF